MVGRKKYSPVDPDDADLEPFANEIGDWMKRLRERAA